MLSMHRASQILRTCCSNLSAWQRGGFVLPNQHIPIGRSTELPSFLTEGDNFGILCSNVHLTPAFQHVSCNLQPERNLQRLQPLDHKRHVGNLREETCRFLNKAGFWKQGQLPDSRNTTTTSLTESGQFASELCCRSETPVS